MVKKILFILIFALLLLLILNNNSFCATTDDLPSYITSRMSSADITTFNNNSTYYLIISNPTNTKWYLLFYNNPISLTTSGGTYYTISPSFYRCFYASNNYNSVALNSYQSNSGKISECSIIYSNYNIIDNVTGDSLYSSTVYYDITYNLNGGSGTGYTDSVEEGNYTILWDGTGITPPNNKIFIGWATTDNATTPDVVSPYYPSGDITLYAVYKTPVYYTITYNLNGGTGNSHTDTVLEGESVTLWSGSNFSPPEDKTFIGWSTISSSSTYNVTSPFTPTGDITLYAIYEYNTSGILSGIRNIISSITNISNSLNPNSVDTSGTQSSINNTASDVKSKFNFTETIKNNVNDMINVITNTESAPTFTINVSSERYTGEVTVIDLNWYAPYREYGNTVICIFVYLSFLWHMFLKIPSIIHGGEATTFSNKNNFDIVRR